METFGNKYTAFRKAFCYHGIMSTLKEHGVAKGKAEKIMEEFFERLKKFSMEHWMEFPVGMSAVISFF